MKIYNKKKFYGGVFLLFLGFSNLILDIIRKDLSFSGLILVVFLLMFGFSALSRSLSKIKAREDKLEALDERNILIDLKSSRKALKLTQYISFALMTFMFVMSKVKENDDFIGIGVGISFCLAISYFAEIGTAFYYESKN